MKKSIYWITKICLLVPALFSSLATEAQEEKPFVTCWIAGQLGNQLCQVATALAYAWDNDAQPIFPGLHEERWNVSYNRDHFFFRLDNSSLPRPILNEYNEAAWWQCHRIPFQKDINIHGVFFCWKHFHHYRDRLVELFAPSEEVETYLQEKYGWLLELPNTVSVHVRTYDRFRNAQGFILLDLDYYKKAMSHFPKDTIFVIFSDRIHWCKHFFAGLDQSLVFIEGNDHVQDFFLMSKMKNHIIANSSFSWWSAYLDNKPNKIVISPRYWYNFKDYYPMPRHRELLFLPNWLLLNVNIIAPYPEDVKLYETQSVEEQ